MTQDTPGGAPVPSCYLTDRNMMIIHLPCGELYILAVFHIHFSTDIFGVFCWWKSTCSQYWVACLCFTEERVLRLELVHSPQDHWHCAAWALDISPKCSHIIYFNLANTELDTSWMFKNHIIKKRPAATLLGEVVSSKTGIQIQIQDHFIAVYINVHRLR